jgi:CRISPR/Cas system endoribonuclease Cas6 (RAMP superfamily)
MNISLVGYDAGLGARNSMGFGLVGKIRNFM